MINVKKIFFLTEEEVKGLQKKDKFICDSASKFPCFELETGKIMYPYYGYPAGGKIWWETVE